VAGVAIVAVAALGALSGLRNRDWATPVRLWESAALVYPTSRSALLFLAGALNGEGRQADRLRVLEAAVHAHPRDVRVRLFYATPWRSRVGSRRPGPWPPQLERMRRGMPRC